MNLKIYLRRSGIAMIELVFSIAVIGIVLMSVPRLVRTSQASTFVALQQESIAAAVSQVNMIMTAQWDHADTNSSRGVPILTTDSTVFSQCIGGEKNPVGVTEEAEGRYCYDTTPGPYAASALGTDGGLAESLSYDDVDDYNNQSYTVTVYKGDDYATYMGDYIDVNITVLSRVYYGDDTGIALGQTITFSNPFSTLSSVGTTNIKLISIELTSSNPAGEISAGKQINFSAFMCNIGAQKIRTNESSL